MAAHDEQADHPQHSDSRNHATEALPPQRLGAGGIPIRRVYALGTVIRESVEREHRLGRLHARLNRLTREYWISKVCGAGGRTVHTAIAYSPNWPPHGRLDATGDTPLDALEALLQRIDTLTASPNKPAAAGDDIDAETASVPAGGPAGTSK